MDRMNLMEYLESGLIRDSSPKIYRTLVSGSGGWTLIGLIYGLVLKNYWIYLSVFMLVAFLVAATIVIVLSSRKLTIRRRLVIQTVISISWVVQISLIEIIIFTMAYGWHICLLLLFFPTILIPLLLGIRTSRMIKKEGYISKKITASSLTLTGTMTGLIGMNFGAIFRNIEQREAIILTLLVMLLLNCIFSIGLLYTQKLYYLFKCEKLGILSADSFDVPDKKS